MHVPCLHLPQARAHSAGSARHCLLDIEPHLASSALEPRRPALLYSGLSTWPARACQYSAEHKLRA